MKIQFPDMTIIVVTHDLASVDRIAGRVLVLGAGRVVFSGSCADLHASQDPYLRDFVNRRFASRIVSTEQADPAVREALAAWLRQ
jgi:phospholipid/cholesterol/gamma-HCH transport system ATP-binding protein